MTCTHALKPFTWPFENDYGFGMSLAQEQVAKIEKHLQRSNWSQWITKQKSMIPTLDRMNDEFNKSNTMWILWWHRIPDEEE